MTRLIQIVRNQTRRVALVEEPNLRLLTSCASVYELAGEAVAAGRKLSDVARAKLSAEVLDYDAIYRGSSEWRILPPIDHPDEPARCMLSGTGLTHLGSARNRQAMHAAKAEDLTDSMKMFRWGMEGGRPQPGCVGISPEWFYKGTGAALRGHGEALQVPAYAEDGGEEAEAAGIYLIGPNGQPYRIGMAAGNEFSDHRFEKKNYLNLAGSKLRTCALGPELVLDPDFVSVPVHVAIERGGGELWSKTFRTGEQEMCHSLQNIEHHHFKFEGHRRPGDVHVHFFGTDYLSFSDGIALQEGDVMQIAIEGFGRPLRNRVHISTTESSLVTATSLD